MKYNSTNKPLVCMQTQSNCYKGTRRMTVKGVLWHSTGANNPMLKRYVQPSDIKPPEDTYTKEKWLEVLGKNQYNNDFNHISRDCGLNFWIGKLADGTVTAVQTMPWDFRPWGCGSSTKGSCNDGWIQFEICEDGLTDKSYFNAVYKEACEVTAYLCKMFNINPHGTVDHNGVTVPTILCHGDSNQLGLGSNHVDINHWFPKHGKSMETARADVAALISSSSQTVAKSYEIVTEVNTYSTASDAKAQKNAKGRYLPGTYYIYSKYPNGVNGMYNISMDKTGSLAGSWINPIENIVKDSVDTPAYDLNYSEKNKIVDRSVNRTNNDCVKAIKKILSNNSDFDVDIAKKFFEISPIYGIDPIMAIAQSVVETGWFKYKGSAVKPEHHNYCGLGVTSTGITGACFETIDDGVTAQLQHLYAYGCTDPLPSSETLLDPRFGYVTRGISIYWQQLAGRWAVPGYDKATYANAEEAMKAGGTYGQMIRSIYKQIVSTSVTEEDVEMYFEKEEVAPVEPEAPEVDVVLPDEGDADLKDNASFVFKWLRKIIEAIIKALRED